MEFFHLGLRQRMYLGPDAVNEMTLSELEEVVVDLFHYTKKPFTLDRNRRYDVGARSHVGKPNGLWVSVGDAWEQWCRWEGWNTGSLAVRYRVTLTPGARILCLTTVEDILAFSRGYQTEMLFGLEAPDWQRLEFEGWQGVVIAPYQWSLRCDLRWYYPWDCASGCIWDLAAINEMTLSELEEAGSG